MKLYKPFYGSYPTSQTFGSNPTYYAQFGQKGHNGIDYAIPSGTPVRAAADGVVDFEGWGQNEPLAGAVAGIYILLEHAVGWTGYAHLNRTIVNKGQKVKAGEIIGYSGASGTVTGAHLHFERFPDNYNLKNGYYGRIDPQPELNISVEPVDPCASVKKELTEAKKVIATQNTTINDYKAVTDALRASQSELQDEVQNLNDKLVDRDNQIRDLTKALEECEAKECPEWTELFTLRNIIIGYKNKENE